MAEAKPARVVVVDNLTRGSPANLGPNLNDSRLEIVRGDIRDAELVRGLTKDIDAVIHAAALRITACAEKPREALEVMCIGSFNVVEAAAAAGVQKIVAASSASVYGAAEDFPTRELHHPYGNDTWYGACKLMLEGLLRSLHASSGLPGISLRYFNVYGEGMDVHGKYTEVLVRWMERVDAGKPPLILGDGEQSMDFIHVDDVARANLLALRSDVCGDVFNIASGRETTLRELAAALLAVMESDLEPEFGPARGPTAVPRRLADTCKAREILGFEARIELSEGLRRLVRWWRSEARAGRAQ
jgi:UDP-glucose 4-epimerase